MCCTPGPEECKGSKTDSYPTGSFSVGIRIYTHVGGAGGVDVQEEELEDQRSSLKMSAPNAGTSGEARTHQEV